jgi:hypothetical protein
VLLSLIGVPGCSNEEAERAAEAARVAREAEDAAKAKVRAELLAAQEVERVKALWTYLNSPSGTFRQTTAAILSSNDVDMGGTLGRVQLVFRDHTSWGRSSYLVLKGDDFACYRGCSLSVTVDSAAPVKMAGRRPQTDDAIAMFVNDWRALWKLTAGANRLSIAFPVRSGGTRTATFDVGGLDRTKMPGWN